jgi:hypothetical protein
MEQMAAAAQLQLNTRFHQKMILNLGLRASSVPLVHPLLVQTTDGEARAWLQQAKQLSSDAASLISFHKPMMDWDIVRPVLRLLLWLLPAHIPARSLPEPAQQDMTATGEGSLSQACAGSTDNERQALALSFVQSVATVSVSKTSILTPTLNLNSGHDSTKCAALLHIISTAFHPLPPT